MIKLGDQRINPGEIVKYFPEGEYKIILKLTNGNNEEAEFTSNDSRNDMLKKLDDYLVSFDNGTITRTDLTDISNIIFGGGTPEVGPGGMPMH